MRRAAVNSYRLVENLPIAVLLIGYTRYVAQGGDLGAAVTDAVDFAKTVPESRMPRDLSQGQQLAVDATTASLYTRPCFQ